MGQISLSHQDPKIKIAVEPHTLKAKVREASPSEIDHHDPTNHHLGHGNERCVGLYPLMMRHSALFSNRFLFQFSRGGLEKLSLTLQPELCHIFRQHNFRIMTNGTNGAFTFRHIFLISCKICVIDPAYTRHRLEPSAQHWRLSCFCRHVCLMKLTLHIQLYNLCIAIYSKLVLETVPRLCKISICWSAVQVETAI